MAPRGGARPGAGRPRLPDASGAQAVTYQLQPEQREAIERIATERGISRSAAARLVIDAGVRAMRGRGQHKPDQ
jgi:hypothetical protein